MATKRHLAVVVASRPVGRASRSGDERRRTALRVEQVSRITSPASVSDRESRRARQTAAKSNEATAMNPEGAGQGPTSEGRVQIARFPRAASYQSVTPERERI